MLTKRLVVFALFLSAVCCCYSQTTGTSPTVPGGSDSNSKPVKVAPRAPSVDQQIRRVDEAAAHYRALLDDPDVSGSDAREAVQSLWIDTTCKSKQLRIEQVVGTKNGVGRAVFASCSKRMSQSTPVAPLPAPEVAKAPQGAVTGKTQPPVPPNVNPTPVNAGGGAAANTLPPGGVGANPTPPTASSVPRLQEARTALVGPGSWTPPIKQTEECPIKSPRLKIVDVYYQSGSSSASRLSRQAKYCFAVRDANPLYDWNVELNVTEPTGNPFDLIKDAIDNLSKLASGAASAASGKPSPLPTQPGVKACSLKTDDVTAKAKALKDALDNVVQKDGNGKVIYVPVGTTNNAIVTVTDAYNAFEKSVQDLQISLKDDSNLACDNSLLTTAIGIILDDYPKTKKNYQGLLERMSRPEERHLERPLEPYSSADLVITPSYAGTALSARTVHFDASFPILSSSAGFLLTELQARAYSSATAPDPNDPTKTQNVLKVDDGSGIRPALTVLLTGNVPYVNRHNYGLGVSAGPVFDISNGKADTSRLGFFGGLSLRVTPWIMLTPGVHVGEFADFPQGFTHAGQLIPANTGTPNPTKRYTARFSFAITWKIKDLGAATAQGGEAAQPAKSGNQKPAGSGKTP